MNNKKLSKIDILAMRRAELVAQIKENKSKVPAMCEKEHAVVALIHTMTDEEFDKLVSDSGKTCIQHIYEETAELNKGNGGGSYGDSYSYDEVFENSDYEPCENCRLTRKLKKERSIMKTKLGRINAAITKHGQIMLRKNEKP